MKEITLLTWLTQLGLSVALPLGGWILLSVWLRDHLATGQWIVWAGVILGVVGAVDGLYHSLKALSRLTKEKGNDSSPPVSFNDHD